MGYFQATLTSVTNTTTQPPLGGTDYHTVQSGNWNATSTWANGKIPGASNTAYIEEGHTVTLTASTTVAGIDAMGNLVFSPSNSVTLTSTKNIFIQGLLQMKPNSASIVHKIIFTGINENNYVGGGLKPALDGSGRFDINYDVGLWILEMGKLDLVGTTKKPWTRATGSVLKNATSFTVEDATGWRVGDEIFIVPTREITELSLDFNETTQTVIDPIHSEFERRTITAISGNTVTINSALVYDHLQVVTDDNVKTWKAEVGNLTRNVVIQGTSTGRAHIMAHTHMNPHTVKHVEGAYLGPRKIIYNPENPRTQNRKSLIQGRYGLHFHHCGDTSTGTLVEGCAFHDIGNRTYVPHLSHGITMKDNVAFNGMEDMFWWDFQEQTHFLTYDGNLMALRSWNGVDPLVTGMLLNMGDGNKAINNVAVYCHTLDENAAGAYNWGADSEGVWIFENNMAHTNITGLWVWQNTTNNHTIINYDSYNNFLGIMHGAYGNAYNYDGGYHYRSTIRVKASSANSYGVVFKDMTINAAGREYASWIQDSPIPNSGQNTNKYIRCNFKNYTVAAVRLYTSMPDSNGEKQFKWVDIIHPTTPNNNIYKFDLGNNVDSYVPKNGNRIRVLPTSGTPTQAIINNGTVTTSNISAFAPSIWGSGKGLLGSYYSGSNYETFKFNRLDSMIMFQAWSVDKRMSPYGVHYLTQGDAYSIRWEGYVEAQYSESHTFYVSGGGGHRFYITINGTETRILDSWAEKSDNAVSVASSAVSLVAGQKYKIKLEHFNASGARACMLSWTCPSMGGVQLIPMSQLYDPNTSGGGNGGGGNTNNLIYFEDFEGSEAFTEYVTTLRFTESHSFSMVTTPLYKGSKVGRIELRHDDSENNGGVRAEVRFPEQEHHIRWFSWALYFPSATYEYDDEDEVLAQWHQLGGYSPSISLRSRYDKLYLYVKPTTTTTNRYDMGLIPKDQWMNITFRIVHSHLSDGRIEVWINGQKAQMTLNGQTYNGVITGPNTYDLSIDPDLINPRWNVGIYKSAWNGDQRTLADIRIFYIDNIKIGNENATLEEMIP